MKKYATGYNQAVEDISAYLIGYFSLLIKIEGKFTQESLDKLIESIGSFKEPTK